MSLSTLSKNAIYPSYKIPLTLMLLEEWSFVYVEGCDAKKYLQNQLTIDMKLLKETNHTFCAHCNFNGKVWSTMRLFHYRDGYGYIQRKSISKVQIKELQKYSIFSKIKIYELNDIYLIGIAGLHSRSFLLNFFDKIPDLNLSIIHEYKKTILCISKPIERFLLVLTASDFLFLKNSINKTILFNDSKQWLSLEIESGFPIIDEQCSKKFTPQAINLDKLEAISFNKGCYYGQETIARIFFKNLNKYHLYCLIGKGNIFPEINSFIEIKLEEKWCKIGVLLSLVHVNSEEMLIQVVLYKSVNINNLFRIYGFENIFFIQLI
ncbi:tRNA-modifying protein YgfZ [Buchnera aphidicola]|uniref:tRNA-modifying protein YgfZ n=1 Tax=Buchnera aphidicola (Lipaphis pseudobrassicae) TaxID=1258543 RepID=A0A4D6Y7V4_9GAMM|nr:tRNA-modifying protein YgfZ [Buchnera aphidicola]QCI22281.1 tRNA-modifying protein YgfZ [Buchnera aphidicola (Lipaphis pseudobrassicae)]